MTEPKFDTGPDSNLEEYTVKEMAFGGWQINGKTKCGQSFQVSHGKGDQHCRYPKANSKCLNWRDL
tara:strand:+ start:149 stop:346 length:198 start_codon:yes stop_codon:yes gene_type:complete